MYSSSHLQQALKELNLEQLPIKRVLVVDDEPDVREVLCALLEDDWEVLTAGNGKEALALLQTVDDVDVVLSDQRMPEMTGVELLSRVAETNANTIRIVLTGYSDIEPMLDAINSGQVYRFLLKPFEPAEIQSVVADAMQLKASTAALHLLLNGLTERNESQRLTHEKLRAAQEQLLGTERLGTLGRATSAVTHDLRNLLTIMSLILQNVQQATDDHTTLQSAQQAFDSVNSLVSLLNGIHDFARSTAVTNLVRQQISAKQFCDETVSLFGLEDGGKDRTIVVDISRGLVEFSADVNAVRQALLALLRNASLASPPNTPIRLSLRQGATGKNVCFDVQDMGHGIPIDIQERVVEPFFSAFQPRGLGLGLAIVKLIAEAHGGRLELLSLPQKGTTAKMVIGT